MNKKHVLSLFVAFSVCCGALPLQAETLQATPLSGVAASQADGSSDHQTGIAEKIAIVTHKLEIGTTLTLTANHPDRHLVMQPDVATVVSMSATAIKLQALQVGSTLILIWEGGTVRSLRIEVLPKQEEIKQRQKLELLQSPLYQSRRKRFFRFSYETRYTAFHEGGSVPRSHETRKVGEHRLNFEGDTPAGLLAGQFFYEYRKDQVLKDAVMMPQDFRISLRNSQIPFVRGYDFTAGTQFLQLNNYGFSGSRFEGLTMLPSLTRRETAKTGTVLPFFFMGQERDGSLVDAPAGIRNRKLKDKIAGQGFDFYLWNTGYLTMSTFQRWSGPKGDQGKKNFDIAMNLRRGKWKSASEIGFDDLQQAAFDLGIGYEGETFATEHRWLNIDKNYRTVLGPGSGRGVLGYRTYTAWTPSRILWGNDRLSFYLGADVLRNRLSPNIEHPRYYTWAIRNGVNVQLWRHSDLGFSFFHDDQRASSSPRLQKGIHMRWNYFIPIYRYWIDSIGLNLSGGGNFFRKAVDAPGQNANRYNFGPGVSLSLLKGLFLAAQYQWYQLDELERTDPGRKTYPSQLTLDGGYAYELPWLPVQLRLGVRYSDERQTFNKPLQPFLNQDRLQGNAGIDLRLSQKITGFIEINAVRSKSIFAQDNQQDSQGEWTITAGMRTSWVSPFYIPVKGRIEGVFFNDINGNGIRDGEEPGLSGFKIMIPNGPSTKTNRDGRYALKIKEGQMVVHADLEIPDGHFYTTVNRRAVDVLPGERIQLDFGITAQVQIRGRVYLDLNQNVFFDEGDIPLAGVILRTDTGQSVMSSGEGLYSLLHIPPGSNVIRIDLGSFPGGYTTTSPTLKKIAPVGGDVVTFDVQFRAERTVSGRVFEDQNGDGESSDDEPGIQGVILVTSRGEKAVSGGNGEYFLRNLQPGAVQIEVSLGSAPEGYTTDHRRHDLDLPAEPYERRDLNFPLKAEKSVPDV